MIREDKNKSNNEGGIDFNEDLSLDDIDKRVVPIFENITGSSDIQTQKVANSNEVIIKSRFLSETEDNNEMREMRETIMSTFDIPEDRITTENISGAVSVEMRRDAIIAVVLATILMLIYIWIRFKDIKFGKENLQIISPDIGAMQRNIYFANVLGIDLGFFYKRRDYSTVVDGKNPIVAHEYMGSPVKGKDIVVIDDMIASGDSLIETAKSIKEKGAKRVFACCTFGLFTKGLDNFDKAYEEGIIDQVFTTNCIYQLPELKTKKWYTSVDVTEYIARIIESINHDSSISQYLDPYEKIKTKSLEN